MHLPKRGSRTSLLPIPAQGPDRNASPDPSPETVPAPRAPKTRKLRGAEADPALKPTEHKKSDSSSLYPLSRFLTHFVS